MLVACCVLPSGSLAPVSAGLCHVVYMWGTLHWQCGDHLLTTVSRAGCCFSHLDKMTRLQVQPARSTL